ncbi:MAG: YceD family protein [Candidatus Shikimatogenerans bostrichidophilus]|nr:MAG: YceD family protein [Candidatus Shikimatogenerans bostrichidophilus]
MNSILKKFYISLLPNNENFKFFINSNFFKEFLKEEEDYLNPKINIIIKKKNKNSYIVLKIYFIGVITLICDITLNKFLFKINKKKKLNIFFSNNYNNKSDNNIFLPLNTIRINIAQYIYDSVILMLPIKKIHPKIKKIYKKYQ